MTSRHSTLAVIPALIAAPLLAFPSALGGSYQWVPVAVACVALIGAVGLLWRSGRLARWAAVLALMTVVGWLRAGEPAAALNHFTGVALGLLAMGAVAVWCTSRERFMLVTTVFLFCGVAALSVGRLSATEIHGGKALPVLTQERTRGPWGEDVSIVPLPLRDLHKRTSVNPNALAATAGMVLPVAAAAALTPARWFSLQVALRFAAGASAVLAGVVLLMMQSRSAWVSALILLGIVAKLRLPSWLWWSAIVAIGVGAVVAGAVWMQALPVAGLTVAFQDRIGIWGDALSQLWSSPWVGIGLDQYRTINTEMIHAHNIVIQTALDVGLLGLVAYVAVVVLVLKRAGEVVAGTGGDPWIRAVSFGAALTVASVHLYGLFDAVPLGAKVGIFQWLACGLVLAAWRLQGDIDYDPGRPVRSEET